MKKQIVEVRLLKTLKGTQCGVLIPQTFKFPNIPTEVLEEISLHRGTVEVIYEIIKDEITSPSTIAEVSIPSIGSEKLESTQDKKEKQENPSVAVIKRKR